MRFLMPFLLALLCCPAHAQPQTDGFTVNVHETSEPSSLNPLTSTAANAENIEDNIFCRLLEINRKTFELEPVLAVARPKIIELASGKYKGGLSLEYEIRPEATWDDGKPVTGHDYLFTVKASQHKSTNAYAVRSSLEFIDAIEVDASNPKKFTIYTKQRFFMAENASGYGVHVLPEQVYDPKQVLRGISIADLKRKKEYSEPIQQFAQDFNDPKYERDLEYIKGCGPYALEEWDRMAMIVLKRKKNWWGDKIKDNKYLKAYPDKIAYTILSGSTWVLSKMKEGAVDVARSIDPTKFREAQADEALKKEFDFYNPSQFAYHYIGLNAKSPKLSDKRVREAIACAVDRKKIIEEVFFGEAIATNGPISPEKAYYNKDLPSVAFDLEKARELLEKAGWQDETGDDVLDKKIGGELVSLRLKYNYNKGNMKRKAIGQMMKANLAKIGIKLDLYPIDFATLLQSVQNKAFEVYSLAWVLNPGLDDLKNVWHTSSANNRVSFGNAKTDKMIDELRMTMDETKRNALYMELQAKIVEEHPYVFLVVPNEFIMIRKGFKYPELGPVRPGYVIRLFQKE